MICQPCKVDDHDNCTPTIGAMSLGMQDECLCWRYNGMHVVLATPAPQPKDEYDGWTADEIRDHRHDNGEEEFDWEDSRRGLSIELEEEIA